MKALEEQRGVPTHPDMRLAAKFVLERWVRLEVSEIFTPRDSNNTRELEASMCGAIGTMNAEHRRAFGHLVKCRHVVHHKRFPSACEE